MCIKIIESILDQEEETKEIIESGDDKNITVSARPRRMSEVHDPPQPILPIPEGSAFFILSQTSRCDTIEMIKKPEHVKLQCKFQNCVSILIYLIHSIF